jgi:methionyl-tRNA formyltransferase
MADTTSTYTIAIAGTTQRATQCARALLEHPAFTVSLVLTPTPKPVGRKQILTANPLHTFAQQHTISTLLIDTKITSKIKNEVLAFTKSSPIDFLLVVDFGYIVPDWLLRVPTIAPLNIHPSNLPRWRGSSPGQFALLFGDTTSAVTLMVMDTQLDHGPIITSLPFEVDPNWTASEYYQYSFDRITAQLPKLLLSFAQNKISLPQPDTSPTPLARKIEKEDAFVPWSVVLTAMKGETLPTHGQLSELLAAAVTHHTSISKLLEHATRAFNPWPMLWTKVPTSKGEKRMKIISTALVSGKLVLRTVQLEGKSIATFNEIKNIITQ